MTSKNKCKQLTFRRHSTAAMLEKRGNMHIIYYNVYCLVALSLI